MANPRANVQKLRPELQWSLRVDSLNAIKPRFARLSVEEDSLGAVIIHGNTGRDVDFDDMVFE